MKLLIDLDNTLGDFDIELQKIYREMYPDNPLPPIDRSKKEYLQHNYPEPFQTLLTQIVEESPTLHGNLEPIEGGLEAIYELKKIFDVYIVSAPHIGNNASWKGKADWVERHFDYEMVKRLIVTNDKTIIDGDYLIDDKPKIIGANEEPAWKQILYSQPYNQHITNKKRVTWQNWRDVLLNLTN